MESPGPDETSSIGAPAITSAFLIVLSALITAGCTGQPVSTSVVSYLDRKYVDITRQSLDFSCGAASVATLLNSYFDERFTEAQLLQIIRFQYNPVEWKKKRDKGLSFADLVYIASQVGYEAQGAQIGLSGLLQVNGPVIVHLNKGDFQHFSVFRGTVEGTIMLADPITGHTRYSPGQFSAQYTGYALAIWKAGRELPTDYALKVQPDEASHERMHVRQAIFDRFEGAKTPF